MRIKLDNLVKEQVNIARNLSAQTGETFTLTLGDVVIAETYFEGDNIVGRVSKNNNLGINW